MDELLEYRRQSLVDGPPIKFVAGLNVVLVRLHVVGGRAPADHHHVIATHQTDTEERVLVIRGTEQGKGWFGPINELSDRPFAIQDRNLGRESSGHVEQFHSHHRHTPLPQQCINMIAPDDQLLVEPILVSFKQGFSSSQSRQRDPSRCSSGSELVVQSDAAQLDRFIRALPVVESAGTRRLGLQAHPPTRLAPFTGHRRVGTTRTTAQLMQLS